MRAVIQRVKKADVKVSSKEVSSINEGFLILLAVHKDDKEETIKKMAEKIVKLRIFEDKEGKMNLDIKEIDGEILLVSQFTLYGNANKGNRPSFIDSARPEKAEPYYVKMVEEFKSLGIKKVATGSFGDFMEVSSINNGPTTIILDL